jgi:hypothetical protein
MSYPQILPDSDPAKDYVSFSVPNKRVVRKIARDFNQDEDLRVQVLSRALTNYIDELALLFSRFELDVSPADSRNESRVVLYARPRKSRALHLRMTASNSYKYMHRLNTIAEECEEA